MQEYDERLWAPWYYWLAGLAAGGLLAAEVHLGYSGLRSWLPYVLVLPVVLGALWWLSRGRVRVAGGELYAGAAHLPVRVISAVQVLDAPAKRRLLGVDADPMAFVVHRPWIGPAVLITLDDPADATPSWVLSSGRPEELRDALQAAQSRQMS